MISQRAFGKLIGVSHTAVQKAIKTNRIPVGRNGQIDPEKARAAWEANTLPDSRSRPNAAATEDDAKASGTRAAFAVSRAIREGFEAKLAKLEFEERSIKLIDRGEVERLWFEKARLIRDGVLAVPDRLASLLASVTDRHKVHQLLDTELRKALNDIADAVQQSVN